MLFKRKKKTEQTDELHHEYGLISNCGYIIRAFLRYRKSTVAFLLLGGIAGASMSYIWTVIAKLVIDMITQQAGTSGHDITPLLWLVAGTTAVEFVMMWLNTLSAKKLRIGFRAALLYEVVGVESVGERHHADVKPGFAQYVESSQRCGLPRAVTVVAYIHVGRIVAD